MSEQTTYLRPIRAQGIGSFAEDIKQKRIDDLYRALHKINAEDIAKSRIVAQHEKDALKHIDSIRDFVGAPEKILGSSQTKHGEIAEHIEVGFRNAWSSMRGKPPVATFDGVGRTAPEDFIINGIRVQSKYINGASNSLSHVIDHLETYKSIRFGVDGSYYIIPKDQYQLIQSVLSGNIGDLNAKTVRAIRGKVSEIESATGHCFADVVKPGQVDYAEVQQGVIHKTLDFETEKIKTAGAEQKEAIHRQSEQKRESAVNKAKPSLGEATKVAGISAGISGGFQLAIGIHQKCSSGRKLADFTEEDWTEIGIDTIKAGAEGGISGYAIYAMTNWGHVSTPIAGAAVSFAFGTVDLIANYSNGSISKNEFINGCRVLCIQSVMCAVGAAIGDRLIPIPILGCIIGATIAGNITEELLGNGVYGAAMDTSNYVYGSSLVLVDALRTMTANHYAVQQNMRMSASALDDTDKKISDMLAALGGNW